MDTLLNNFTRFYATFINRFETVKECEDFFNHLRPYARCKDKPDYFEACIQCCFDIIGMPPTEAKMRFDEEIQILRAKEYEYPLFCCLKGNNSDEAAAILVEVFHITEEQARSRLAMVLVDDIDTDEKIRMACQKLLYPGVRY